MGPGGGDRKPFRRFRVHNPNLLDAGLVGDWTSGVSRGGKERAILANCPDHYELMRKAFPEKLHLGMSGEEAGSGENLYIEGLNKYNLCIGHVFTVSSASGGASKGLLQV